MDRAAANDFDFNKRSPPAVPFTTNDSRFFIMDSIARFTRVKRPIFLNKDVDAAQVADHQFVTAVIPLPLGTFWFWNIAPRIRLVHVGLN